MRITLKWNKFLRLTCLYGLSLFFSFAAFSQSTETFRVNVKTLFQIPDNGKIYFSQNGERFIITKANDPKITIQVDSQPETEFSFSAEWESDEFYKPLFSADGKKYAMLARLAKERFAVVDGVRGQSYQEIHTLRMAKDGSRIAYVAGKNSKYIVVDNGVESNPYDEVLDLYLSDDGKILSYCALAGRKSYFILNGKESKPYDIVAFPAVSVDGMRCAFWARANGPFFVMTDWKQGRDYDDFGVGPFFSPDGKRTAYSALNGKTMEMVADETKLFSCSSVNDILFSPDGKRLAAEFKRSGKAYLWLDGIESKACDSVGFARESFSADSKQFAWWYKNSEGRFLNINNSEKMVDGVISDFSFSPNGTNWTYVSAKNDKYCIINNWKMGKTYDEVTKPTYSPEGKYYIYTARNSNKWFLILNNADIAEGKLLSMRWVTKDDQQKLIAILINNQALSEITVELNAPKADEKT